MIKELRTRLHDVTMSLANAIDLVSPALANHHKRTAYLASALGVEMGLPRGLVNDLLLAGLVHDCGALSLASRLDALEFETEDADHPHLGYLLLRGFGPFESAARLVRNHHVRWDREERAGDAGAAPVPAHHVLHLADRVAVLLPGQREVLAESKGIIERIGSHSGGMFAPPVVEALRAASEREAFWLDAAGPEVGVLLGRLWQPVTLEMDLDGLASLATLFGRVIDFRSRFTATHSTGVAATAVALGGLLGLCEREIRMIRVAGFLHDLGKLAVPAEVLEKPGKLDAAEWNLIRQHTFHTYRVLETIPEMETINRWASFHHERLDGRGYPFRHRAGDLDLGSRILAVADVFTAITEDRPYRPGMSAEQARGVLGRMVAAGALDRRVVDALCERYDDVDSARAAAQREAAQEYREFGAHRSVPPPA